MTTTIANHCELEIPFIVARIENNGKPYFIVKDNSRGEIKMKNDVARSMAYSLLRLTDKFKGR